MAFLGNWEAWRCLHTNTNFTKNDTVCVLSYNSRGFSDIKADFIKLLVSDTVTGNKIPFLCNQENFLLKDNSYKIKQAIPDFQLVINPAIKKDLNHGRPSNGMFIAFPDSIKNQVTDVSPGFWRLQAVKIKFMSSNLLLINSYFPTDPQRNNADNAELLETLGHIKQIIEKNSFDTVLWAGDINSDFSRNSNHTRAVKDALEDLGLLEAWDQFTTDFTCTHEMLGQTFTSTLDHFFWNPVFCTSVIDAGVLHLPGNMSDHSPIYCTFDASLIQENLAEQKRAKPRPSWKRASPEEKSNFKLLLEESLSLLNVPESVQACTDVHCQNTSHKEDLDRYTLELLDIVQNVAEEILPIPAAGDGKRKSITPGWNSEVKPFRDNAHFWHQVWQSCGRPLNCEVHNIMKKTRNLYHYQYRKCRNAEEKIKRDKLLNACLGDGGDLFEQIKALRKSPSGIATSIDGVSADIPGHFSAIYSQLYNSADDSEDLKAVHARVEAEVNMSHLDKVAKITPELLRKAASKLKPGKSDPIYSFSSDCFRDGPDSLYKHLANVLKCCTVHSHVSLVLLLSTLIPLVKDKLTSINISKNYRSVAVSSILLKLFDWVVIFLDGDSLGLNELQFAYQTGCSTVMCTWAALETIDYFLKNGNEVFTCATDMSKAFDLTLHSLMFTKMLDAGMSPILVRLLIHIYAHQEANVRWNGENSSKFSVRNGCGQGKVLAALAYCLYCEELFETLRRRHSGCWIGGHYRGIFGYSDDNWVLAPSLSALQDILKTCEEYAASHNLKFSTDIDPVKCKTKCMAFLSKPRTLPDMYLCGNPLPWVNSLKHLGTRVSNCVDGCQLDMKQKQAQYIDKNCTLDQEFHFAHPSVKLQLNNIYNCHFSGSQVWNLFSQGALSLEGTYNRSVKVMANLPYQTHRYMIEPISGTRHMKMKILKNYLSFIQQVKKSTKHVLRQLYSLASNDVRTVTGQNLRNILLMTNKLHVDQLDPSIVSNLEYHKMDKHETWRTNLVREILDLKHGNLVLPDGWSDDELEEILNLACTQ